MPEFNERRLKPNIEIDYKYTLDALKKLLTDHPDVLGDKYQEIKDAVEDAEAELAEKGLLSQTTAENLDNLQRPFK